MSEVQAGSVRRDPFTERLGIENTISNVGECVTTCRCDLDKCNIYGVVHGALLFAMADVGMGMALAAALPGAPRLGSISVSANFVTAAKPGVIVATSKLVRTGRSVAFLTSEIRDGAGAEVARFTGVFHIYPEQAL